MWSRRKRLDATQAIISLDSAQGGHVWREAVRAQPEDQLLIVRGISGEMILAHVHKNVIEFRDVPDNHLIRMLSIVGDEPLVLGVAPDFSQVLFLQSRQAPSRLTLLNVLDGRMRQLPYTSAAMQAVFSTNAQAGAVLFGAGDALLWNTSRDIRIQGNNNPVRAVAFS